MVSPEPSGLLHHGDVEARGAQVDFAVNVIGERPPPFMLDALGAELGRVASYPDEAPTREILAGHLGIAPSGLLLVNGVAEAFSLVASMRAWQNPLVVHPQFTEPEAALRARGFRPARVLLEPHDFSLTPAMLQRIEQGGPADPDDTHPRDHDVRTPPDLVVLGNPTNPTSRLHAAEAIAGLVAPERAPDRLVVIDEAFMDVVSDESESLLEAAAEGEGMLVFRSLTKTFALAGVRAGFVVGGAQTIARLRALQPPWSVNSLALAATRASVTDDAQRHVHRVRDEVRIRRTHLEAGLTARGWRVVPDGRAPFVLARHPRAEALRTSMRERGVAIRRGDTFPGLDDTWARFAVRGQGLVDRLFAALDSVEVSADREARAMTTEP